MRRQSGLFIALGLGFVTAAGCGGTDLLDPNGTTDGSSTATACIPGQSIACVGSGGCASNQVCNSDGQSYGACDCAPNGATVCVPGQSIACVGSGGCTSNQVCNSSGTAYGPCDCTQTIDASTPCVPGQSIACTGTGGCISNQVCNTSGTGYGPCGCVDNDGSTPVCIPGQSIACTGLGGCFSNQVCNNAGTAYGPCACSDAGSVECETAADCANLLGPLPNFCTSCKNGQGCLHYVCILGTCQTSFCN